MKTPAEVFDLQERYVRLLIKGLCSIGQEEIGEGYVRGAGRKGGKAIWTQGTEERGEKDRQGWADKTELSGEGLW